MPKEVVPVNDCSHYKICLSYTEMKPLLVQLVPVAPCLLHVEKSGEEAHSLRRVSLHLLCSCPLSTGIL